MQEHPCPRRRHRPSLQHQHRSQSVMIAASLRTTAFALMAVRTRSTLTALSAPTALTVVRATELRFPRRSQGQCRRHHQAIRRCHQLIKTPCRCASCTPASQPIVTHIRYARALDYTRLSTRLVRLLTTPSNRACLATVGGGLWHHRPPFFDCAVLIYELRPLSRARWQTRLPVLRVA